MVRNLCKNWSAAEEAKTADGRLLCLHAEEFWYDDDSLLQMKLKKRFTAFLTRLYLERLCYSNCVLSTRSCCSPFWFSSSFQLYQVLCCRGCQPLHQSWGLYSPVVIHTPYTTYLRVYSFLSGCGICVCYVCVPRVIIAADTGHKHFHMWTSTKAHAALSANIVYTV